MHNKSRLSDAFFVAARQNSHRSAWALCVKMNIPQKIVAILAFLPVLVTAEQEIDATLVHPPFDTYYMCIEHAASLDFGLGDALGADCIVQAFPEGSELFWLKSHTGNGSENEDWYGWRHEVLSPCDCSVVDIHINDTTNSPGKMTPGRASSIKLRADTGVMYSVAHVREVKVEVGDRVEAGQPIARVGNNGYSRHPHVHIGAWKDDKPLQIRFDLSRMAIQ